MQKIRVLIVDDSALVRKLLTEILSTDPQIEVVGSAQDPYIARNKIKELNPDVLTLDIEMPRMDGITFLTKLMKLRPIPVVMVSTMTEQGAEVSLKALELGAVDIVSKPKEDIAGTLHEYTEELVSKVKNAATANLKLIETNINNIKIEKKLSVDAILAKEKKFIHNRATEKIIAVGASTGGTEAIKDLLMQLPADTPGIVITQHIPEAFSLSFANRMNSVCKMVVCEASDGQQVLAGHVYIAPGNRHLLVERTGKKYVCKLNDGPAVNRHRPSVDVLFRSLALCAGRNAVGIILTGMGNDGAQGLYEMHETGSPTIAQDEKTSVVWGMPGEAVKMGGVDSVLALNIIPGKLLSLTSGQ